MTRRYLLLVSVTKSCKVLCAPINFLAHRQTNCVKTLLGFPLHEGNTVTAPYVGNGKKILQGDYSIRGLGKHLLHLLVLDEELVENELKTGTPNLQLYFQLIQIKHFLLQNPH